MQASAWRGNGLWSGRCLMGILDGSHRIQLSHARSLRWWSPPGLEGGVERVGMGRLVARGARVRKPVLSSDSCAFKVNSIIGGPVATMDPFVQ